MPEFLNKTMITEDDFTLLNCIGRGAFGCVYQICLKNNPKVVFALKVQKKCEILSQNVANQVKNEASIQVTFQYKHVFITCWQSRTKLFTLMQCSGGYGDLRNLWEDFGPFKSSLIRIYAAEIAIALDYCHRNSVIYRDLKLENVTLTVDGHIQITDFGFAKRLADDDRTTTICGTLQYMAPEVAFGQPYSKYIDWWCFGVLLHVLHTGHYPYPNSEAKSHSDLGTTLICNFIIFFKVFQLLDVNLAKRICSYNAVRDHSFFRLFEWDVVAIRKVRTSKVFVCHL
uniref:Protein kinase domain-containing protein n=1 Tax=Syphacia muris TaxID=451379 RepID=A0A0N5ADZ3_9BILA